MLSVQNGSNKYNNTYINSIVNGIGNGRFCQGSGGKLGKDKYCMNEASHTK